MKASLVHKYNKAVPRYTSYPPVPEWNNKLNQQAEWLQILGEDIRSAAGEGISLYIHLPFCESLCTYCGCNKRITQRHEMEQPYVEAIKKEWDIYLQAFDFIPKIKYLHLGGGTPTFFSAENLKSLIKYILSGSRIAENHAFSFEGHPNNTTHRQLQTLFDLGFDRVSYGVQDFNLEVQKAIHRVQPTENVEHVVNWARAIGYKSVNFDLVYGLPFQTSATIADTIIRVKEFKPERIALYSYAHVPWVSRSQRGYDERHLPSPEEKLLFYQHAKDQLINAGYVQIGMDHFALPEDELSIAKRNGTLNRNFMGYTVDNCSQMIGLGCSAISSATHGFVQNEKRVETYQEAIMDGVLPIIKSHHLNRTEVAVSEIINGLICNYNFDFSQRIALFDNAFEQLNVFREDGLIEMDGYLLAVTEKGKLFIRNICAAFDPFMTAHQKQSKQIFSQSV